MAGPTKIERDHYLFREGDPPDAMYVVKSGKFAVVKSKSNSEIVLAEIGPGAMVGEMAFFDNKPRSASVKALKDSEVVALPYKALHAQFANFPEWCKAIMRTVNDHLRNANQRLKQLEKSEKNEDEMFPPHTITKLMSILNLVGARYGKASEEGLNVPGFTLRNYTIQIFQEPTHKMQKLMNALMELKLMSVEDAGEGKQKIILFKPDLMFSFVEWYNEWLFKKETDRVTIKEDELKILNGVAHFAKKLPKNDKGLVKLNLTEVQNESMKELGFLIKVDDVNSLIEKKILTDKMMEETGLFTLVQTEEIEKWGPYWGIIYGLKKVTRSS
jgi:CRP/FNR family cyclic AMP-dependent transcriptional regulator